MKESQYFSHDAFARHDRDLANMRNSYGMKGYGMYWSLIEMMREAEEDEFKLRIGGDNDIHRISKELGVSKVVLTKFIKDCIDEFHLFRGDGQYIWSEDLLTRMKIMLERRSQSQRAARARWSKPRNVEQHGDIRHADALRGQSDRTAEAMPIKESKEKKNEIQENKIQQTKVDDTIIQDQNTGDNSFPPFALPDDPLGIEHEPTEKSLQWFSNEDFYVCQEYCGYFCFKFDLNPDQLKEILDGISGNINQYRGGYKSLIESKIWEWLEKHPQWCSVVAKNIESPTLREDLKTMFPSIMERE